MLSTISPIFQSEPVLGCGKGFGYGNLLSSSSSQDGFTSWENLESFFVSQDVGKQSVDKPKSEPSLNCDQVSLGSGLDDTNQKRMFHDGTNFDYESPNQTPVLSSSGSDDPNQNPNNSNSGSNHNNEERKRRRMVSNRESAKRSRTRKQQHVDNLRNEANRLELENQEGTNQLRLMIHNVQRVTSDNNRLKAEYVILQRRLMELNQIWQIQQFHQINTNQS
ncbi:hypothetical protein RND81_11G212300 [Saponaria officinalis]|uniref:BZIP domain-containing protein n=1 Tax=Saponaria officinalis TaxID=3572 RepID=A0AAW1HQB7_SAPOF